MIALVVSLLATLGLGNDTAVQPALDESTAQSKEALHVFFIGNSHTGCNNLMKVIQKLALKGKGDTDMVTAGHLVGGCTLERHWNDGNERCINNGS